MDPFIGEIRTTGFNFAPKGWALCNGQTLPISQNTALFSLLGTTYGGDGLRTFALPNLQAASPLHLGQGQGLSNYTQGQIGGEFSVSLTTPQLPQHTHSAQGSSNLGSAAPAGKVWAKASGTRVYANGASLNAPMGTGGSPALLPAGSGQAHDNLAPYLVVNFIIALQGIFPPRS